MSAIEINIDKADRKPEGAQISGMGLTTADLLNALRERALEDTRDLFFHERDGEERAMTVFLQKLPDAQSATKKTPYALIQAVTGTDAQKAGQEISGTASVRMVFCVYDENAEMGSLKMLTAVERTRISFLRNPVIGKAFEVDLTQKIERMYYQDDTGSYHIGEIAAVFKMPPIQREIQYLGGNFLW